MKHLHKTLLLVTACGLAILAACAKAPPPGENATDAQPTMDSLVSAEWLMNHIGDPDLVVLDATVLVQRDAAGNMELVNGRASYEEGHIPGAGFADLRPVYNRHCR